MSGVHCEKYVEHLGCSSASLELKHHYQRREKIKKGATTLKEHNARPVIPLLVFLRKAP